VNPSDTLTFLQCLEPDYQDHVFYWSGLHPSGDRTQAYGTIEEMLPLLVERNADGYGIFTTVNAMTPNHEGGYARRRKQDVARVRAVFADWDNGSEDIPDVPLPPSMIVSTSPGKFHLYWCTDDMPLEMFESVQRGVVLALGSDSSVVDLSREMRVPGFLHTKNLQHRTPVRLLECLGTRYPYDMLRDAFPFEMKAKHHEAWDGTVRKATQLTEAVVAAAYGPPKADGGKAYAVPCPWAEHHTTNSTKTSTVYYPPAEDNGGEGYFLCLHSHCKDVRFASDYDAWIAERVLNSLK
jgi:hypothetical protein